MANNYNSPYEATSTQTSASWTFSQSQSKLMTRSFLYTGISFVAIFLLSLGIYFLLPSDDLISAAQTANVFLAISPILVLVSSLMGIFIRPRSSGGMAFIAITYTLYIIAQSIGLGGLFFAIQFTDKINGQPSNLIDIVSIFGVAGLMFIGMAIVGSTLSRKAGVKFSRFLMAAFFAYMLSSLIFSISFIFIRGGAFDWLIIASTLIGGLLNMGYIVFIVFQMKQSSDFVDLAGNAHFTNTLSLYYGFWMLVSLMGLVWQLLRLYLFFKR